MERMVIARRRSTRAVNDKVRAAPAGCVIAEVDDLVVLRRGIV